MPWIVAAVTVVAALAGGFFVLPEVAWRQVWQALSLAPGGGEAEKPRANGDHPPPAAGRESHWNWPLQVDRVISVDSVFGISVAERQRDDVCDVNDVVLMLRSA